MEGLVSFFREHYLMVGFFLAVCFCLSERYLMPEGTKMGQGEIRTVKGLWEWCRKKMGKEEKERRDEG